MSNDQMLQSATANVQALSDSIASGLQVGEHYVDLLNQLATAKDPHQLLDATVELSQLDLSSPFVKFPQHYQAQDYYLLLMGRLLQLSNIEGMNVIEDESDHQLAMTCQHLGTEVQFRFELDRDNGGAFFTEQEKHEPLFYINLDKAVVRFSNRALINFFVIREIDRYSDLDIQATLKSLTDFVAILQGQLDFTVDLGILNPANDQVFPLQSPDLDLTVIDKLFIKTTDNDFMLLSMPQNNGAKLNLDRQIELSLFYDPDDYSKQWKFRVTDPDEQYSFFDILLHYEMIRDWYLDNREALAVRSDPLVFAE